jgi:hypothetical protein
MLTGVDVLASPCMPSPVSCIKTPKLSLLPLWEEGVGGDLTGVDVLASPRVPSPVSAIRTPKRPLLPLWEKGGWGDEGQRRTGMQKTAHLSQELYP